METSDPWAPGDPSAVFRPSAAFWAFGGAGVLGAWVALGSWEDLGGAAFWRCWGFAEVGVAVRVAVGVILTNRLPCSDSRIFAIHAMSLDMRIFGPNGEEGTCMPCRRVEKHRLSAFRSLEGEFGEAAPSWVKKSGNGTPRGESRAPSLVGAANGTFRGQTRPARELARDRHCVDDTF